MNNRKVIIITGEKMESLSNQLFKIDVHPKCDHSYMLAEFIEENKIEYPYFDFAFSHDLVKMAVLSNVVIFESISLHIISLPNEITDFQLEKLKEHKDLFINDKSIFCLMNIRKERDKLVFEDYSTFIAPKIYDNLIEQKHKKWKGKQLKKIKK